jgi:hypothetical protein
VGGDRGVSGGTRCALNQEAELRRVLLDGDIPLGNTRAERALRNIVVVRKNWLFTESSDLQRHRDCRLHAIDPFVYFDEVLLRRTGSPLAASS